MMMMMMIPQKNVQSSPKKHLKHMCKKKNCGDDDDGTECRFVQTSDGTGHRKFSPNYFFCAIIINRVFFLHLWFRSLFGEDFTFFCGIIIWHQQSFLFAYVFQKFVWRRLHILLWHHHLTSTQFSFCMCVSEVCLEKIAHSMASSSSTKFSFACVFRSLFGEDCILLPPPSSSSSSLLFPFLFLRVSQKQDLILFRIRQTGQAMNHFLHARWRRRRR